MNKNELANKIRELVVQNEFLGEHDKDINNKIISLIRDNLKDLVEIDEVELWNSLAKHIPHQKYSIDSARAIAKENPVRVKND